MIDGTDTLASSFGVCTVNIASFCSTVSTYGIVGVARETNRFSASLSTMKRSTASPCSFCTENAASACSNAGPACAASSTALPAAGVFTAALAIAWR